MRTCFHYQAFAECLKCRGPKEESTGASAVALHPVHFKWQSKDFRELSHGKWASDYRPWPQSATLTLSIVPSTGFLMTQVAWRRAVASAACLRSAQ
jgi:hypothetical protein